MDFIVISLTTVNALLVFALVFFTWQYTSATKRMSDATDTMVRLESDRKVWEVRPVLVPYVKTVKGIGKTRATMGFDLPLLEVGVRNIGLGIAVIEKYKMDFEEMLEQDPGPFTLPVYCPVGEVFTERRIEETTTQKFDKNKWLIDVQYSDMHGNKYFMSYSNGGIDTGLLQA